MIQHHYLVPLQQMGAEKDIAYAVTGKNTEDAADWFVDAKERLLDVNHWSRYSANSEIQFSLSDHHGHPVRRKARRGDHICIDNVHPDGLPGMGYDWAIIEAIEYDDYPDEDTETFAIRVRPAANPNEMPAGENIQEATSTFVIERRHSQLSGTYHGRNQLGIPAAIIGSHHDDEPIETWLGLNDSMLNAMVKGFFW